MLNKSVPQFRDINFEFEMMTYRWFRQNSYRTPEYDIQPNGVIRVKGKAIGKVIEDKTEDRTYQGYQWSTRTILYKSLPGIRFNDYGMPNNQRYIFIDTPWQKVG